MLPSFVMAMTGVQAIQLPLDVKFLVWRFLVLFLHDNQCLKGLFIISWTLLTTPLGQLGSRVFRIQSGKSQSVDTGQWQICLVCSVARDRSACMSEQNFSRHTEPEKSCPEVWQVQKGSAC